MTDDADIRAVLREHGHDVPARGKLSRSHHDLYDQIASGQPEPGGEPWDGDDDEADITEAVIPQPGPGADGEAGDARQPAPERKPRRPGASRPRGSRISSVFSRPKAKSSGKRKAKQPRMPVDRLISRGWEAAARLFGPVSGPVARTLALQAPVAGLVLEDTVRGTIVDTVLQPVIRAEERGKKVAALVGPPLIVLAIERAQGLEEPRRQMQLAILGPMLEESLMLWCDIAESKIDQARERMEADAERREQVRELLAAIFPAATVEEPEPQMAGAM